MTFFFKNWKEEGIDADKFQSFFGTTAFGELQTRVKEINATLDRIEVRKGLEQVMSLGQVANTYFSDHEPWAVIKTDKDKCAEIIAHSAIYALTLGCLFKTYLPELSSKILAYFPEVSDELIRDIYTGEFKIAKEYFGKNIVLTQKPKGLVQKIEADRVKALNEELHSL